MYQQIGKQRGTAANTEPHPTSGNVYSQGLPVPSALAHTPNVAGSGLASVNGLRSKLT